MAEAVAVGALAGSAVSKSLDGIIHVIKKSWKFRSKLNQTEETTKKMKSIFTEIGKQTEKLDESKEEMEMYINQLTGAEGLVQKCKKIKWYSYKRYSYSLELDEVNASLVRFFGNDVQLLLVRDVKKLLLGQKRSEKGSWSGVPLPKGDVIGFEDRVKALKAMVLKDSEVDDCSVVVVSAAGGCGKTILVTNLCNDPDIKENFGRNIYFVTISETPNIKVVVKNLLQKNQGGQQLDFVNDDDAICQWGSFLGENRSQVLLVLDDVWSASIVTDFKFKSPTYKILVTSRSNFNNQFNTYDLQLLNNQDATKLFRHSAFSVDGSVGTDISDALVDEMVKHCKNHPLALSVIGGLLKGTEVASWDGMLKKLCEGTQSVLDLDDSILLCLERSLDVLDKESVIKQCFLDLGLFPEDQKIAATMLMDMWVQLYMHDEKGLDTINQLTELSSKNLATRLQIRKHLPTVANYCEEEFVVQHDMMRTLAIRLSSQEPVEQRMRLIIKANEPDGLVLPQLQHTLNARILSISTDERFSMIWNDYQVPKVEVFVLNFMSKKYDLPQFMQNMESLKVLIITNYGYYFSQLQNFPAPQYLSGLTRIRLEHVSLSSITTSLLELKNLQKLSLIMCKIGNSFNECSMMPNKFPSLLEMEMESCEDLVTFPAMFCNLVCLKKLSITNCVELVSLSEGFGKLTNLEVLRVASCTKLTALPESVIELEKLRIIDLNYCLELCVLPAQIGELGCLGRIHMIGCTGLDELPSSVKDSCSWEVVCDEEIFQNLWSHLPNVKVRLVEEDRLSTLLKII